MTPSEIIEDRISYWIERAAEKYVPASYILDELTALHMGIKLAESGMDRKVMEEICNGGIKKGNSGS